MRPLDQPGRSPVHACHAMAATSHHLATLAAIDTLKAGGNALDAALAACAMQCVVEPQSTGIGGDCFAMVAPGARGTPLAFNGSGRAPAALTVGTLASLGIRKLERDSPHSVIVPGAVDAWVRLHTDYGRLPFADLLAPAIRTARQGYPLSPRVQFDIERQAAYLANFPVARDMFLENGRAPAVGSVRRLPALADALEHIAREGRDGFYKGALAEDMVRTLTCAGGLHTLEDFAAVHGEYVTPIDTCYQGRTVYECPPNGQGVIALLLMNMLDGTAAMTAPPLDVERIHCEIEACRLAYRCRDRYLADPAMADVPLDSLLSADYAAQLVGSIDPNRAVPAATGIDLPQHDDTVYIAVVDAERNVCSFINTLFHSFGSGITTPSGITLTNRGQSFSLDPASPNCIAPGKRPRTTIIPAMAGRKGRIELCFGVMGGDYQALGHLHFLSRFFNDGCDIQEAMDLPRFMVDPATGEVEMESGLGETIRGNLRRRGHRVVPTSVPIGGAQAIAIDHDSGVLTGGSDPRKDGCAIGY